MCSLLCISLFRHPTLQAHFSFSSVPFCCTAPITPPVLLLLHCLYLLCLLSLRALRRAPCSPAAGGAACWAGPAGVCSSGCGQGHGPPSAPLPLPPSPPQDLADVWSGAHRISPRSGSVELAHFLLPTLTPSSPVQPALGQEGRWHCKLSFASTTVHCFPFFTICPVMLSFLSFHLCIYPFSSFCLLITSATLFHQSNWKHIFSVICMAARGCKTQSRKCPFSSADLKSQWNASLSSVMWRISKWNWLWV